MYGRAVAAPLDEASRWLNEALPGADVPGMMLVIGLAEGHLLDALEARGATTKVLAIEPDPDAARRFLQRRDWSAWRSSGRLVHLTGDDYAGASEAWKIFPAATDDCVMLVHPRLLEGAATAKAARVAQTIVAGARANAAARRRFAPRYLTNVIRNIPAIQHGRDVRVLADAYRGTPAVIAAAGPSLDDTLPALSALHRRALLIAVDTALRPLLTAGITPHLVVGADPGAANARHFRWLPPCPDTWLVAESALDAEAIRPFDGRTLWFRLARHQPWPWLNQLGVDIGQLEMWGSVITAAFQLSVLAGCDPIVIVGGDMAFTNGRPYCRGTTYEFDWAYGTANGISLDEWWRGQTSRSAARMTPDVHGRETHSTNALLQFRDWMVERAGRSGRRVVNATGGGTLHGGTIVQSTLADALKGVSGEVVFPPAALTQSTSETGSRQILIKAIEDAQRGLSDTKHGTAPIADWRAFSGDGFDPASVARSFEEASAGLASGVNSQSGINVGRGFSPGISSDLPATPGLKPRPTLTATSGPLPDTVLAHAIPEGVQRWRSLLAGESSAPVAGEEARARVLVDALALIEWMARAVADEACTTPALHKWSKTNAAAWHDLPEPLSWAVALFEASLGHAAGETLPRVSQQAEVPAVDTTWPDDRREDAIRLALAERIAEWMRCAASLSSETKRLSEAADRMNALCRSWARVSAAARDGVPVVLQLSASLSCADQSDEAAGSEPATVTLDLDRSDAAHVLNGCILETCEDPCAVAIACGSTVDVTVVAKPDPSAMLRVALSAPEKDDAQSKGESRPNPESRTPNPVSMASLRELEPRLPPRSIVAYTTEQGAVCVTFHAQESTLVTHDGELRPHARWPLGIIGELPWGDTGAIAWGNGRSDPAVVRPGYVMYRRHAEETPTVVELPFRPVLGSWCGDRVFLSCLASGADGWVGIGSWAPGEEPRREIPGVSAFDIALGSDGDLVLQPCHRRADDTIERRIASVGWRWHSGGALTEVPLGAFGASSHSVVSRGWIATAYPHADAIRFESADGRVRTMVCPSPFRLAWAGSALVVSTLSLDLKMFDDVVNALESCTEIRSVRGPWGVR